MLGIGQPGDNFIYWDYHISVPDDDLEIASWGSKDVVSKLNYRVERKDLGVKIKVKYEYKADVFHIYVKAVENFPDGSGGIGSFETTVTDHFLSMRKPSEKFKAPIKSLIYDSAEDIVHDIMADAPRAFLTTSGFHLTKMIRQHLTENKLVIAIDLDPQYSTITNDLDTGIYWVYAQDPALDASTNAAIELADASHKLPGVTSTAMCPNDMCSSFGYVKTIWGVVQHLNDGHRWTRDQIADWIDELQETGKYNFDFPDS